MLLLITLLSFISIFTVVYLVLITYAPVEGPVHVRLKALEVMGKGRTDIDAELARPFRQRILSPLRGSLAAVFGNLTPRSIRGEVDKKLAMAGGVGRLSTDEFMLLCVFLALSLPAISLFLTLLSGAPANQVVGFTMLSFVAGVILPFLILRHKIAARKLSIQKDLPDVLDLLTVSVEAGLGFDGALVKLSEKMRGALVEEFNRVLHEMRMGVSRREAISALGQRCDVADLSLFTTSLVQADQLGVSIGNVLRVQSAGMREKRRQRAEEQAMKAPIKMMLPLVLFIFPTIFIVLLGPALIQLAGTFK